MDFGDGAEEGAAFFAEASVGEVGVVGAGEPSGGEAAGEGHFEGVAVFGSDGGSGLLCRLAWNAVALRTLHRSVPTGSVPTDCGVEGFAVGAGDGGDVFGGFEAAFDLVGLDAGGDELGDEVDGGEVLGGEEVAVFAHVFFLAVDDEFVGHAAGLGAFATVGGALAEGFGSEALAGVGDAEGAVDEHLERGVFGFVELGDFFDGEFAGENGAFEGEDGFEEAEAIGGGDGHLGGGVDFDLGSELGSHFGEAEVLNDGGVDAGVLRVLELAGGGIEFAGEDEGVHGEEALHAVAVEEFHEFGEVLFGEVVGAEAGVEGGEAEVDGVGASGDGGAGAVPVSGGGEEFGLEGLGHYFVAKPTSPRLRRPWFLVFEQEVEREGDLASE